MGFGVHVIDHAHPPNAGPGMAEWPSFRAMRFGDPLVMDDHKPQNDVKAELDWDHAVNAAHLAVSVSDGTVTLSGVIYT